MSADPPLPDLVPWRLVQGRTSGLEAEVWLLLDGQEQATGAPAPLEGPFSERGRTLTARFPWKPIQRQGQPAWKTTIPEPVLWSPRTPAVYRVGQGEQAPTIGLRDLRVKHDSFFQEDRRWVPRAATDTELHVQDELDAWREADLVPIVPTPSSHLCKQALRRGISIVADLTQLTETKRASEIERLSRFASVALVLLPEGLAGSDAAAAHSHALLGVWVENRELPSWAKFAVVSQEMLGAGWQSPRRLAVVAARTSERQLESPVDLRRECDVFQAGLSRGAEYAGIWLFRKGST